MSGSSDADRTDGELQEREDGQSVLRFARRLEHPVADVWAALTEPARLLGWWGDAQVDLREGGTFTVTWLNLDEDGDAAVMESTITALAVPETLELDGDLHGVLRWELRPEGEGATVLTFTSTLELPPEYRAMTLAGWHLHLDALADVLAGETVDLVDVYPRWTPINARYETKYPLDS